MACGFCERKKGHSPHCGVANPSDPVELCFFDQDPELEEWKHCAAWWAAWYWRSRRANMTLRGRLRRAGVKLGVEHLKWPMPDRVLQYHQKHDASRRSKKKECKRI